MVDYRKIESTSNPLLEKLEKTYIGSFPEQERRAFPLFVELIEREPRFSAYVLLKEGSYIGFLTTWALEGFVYVEHFAIDEAARNGGVGKAAMEQLLKQTSAPVILEVELPQDELSIRRVGFYERLGFRLDDHAYTQPPYAKGSDWLPMYLMSYGKINLNESFEQVKGELYKNVYGVTE
ncbi:ribosomal protein S18 acetylase RimI-like enzyme [Parabacteroides sp. PF5-5]|uniref:GNAT family N-acetyltransferase n=1 Tax=unclassified Parabacteroides TaxID=2649774 RepID=UPI002473F233|nr:MULTISPECIES: GNAT family N-acetyltransferase [unclassified Parabacteroides]MDH6303478.1 ribosomal protein S18 acetylase RimI-like enzyme [Parabacteroides sp. PH5-39]MDH6314800.1 ribosomal protein S18 acetylase RimI-like enzyme [Parabacteroides sp. PF5-13]MDH6318137.1 ribosomal protein S18 acetylase RimI-like enzyme [Parabacteroides sp. PH5-13]MDH6321931.1 ribosomal protein S18 acetylase RimI-like enzyme [Parabacteroides sp. PH5-8]MDH6326055.1 ribosomal protein S18 acetylase RimI-like enzym